MAVIKRADADTFARKAVSLHLGDLNRQGDELVARARQEAGTILAEARAEAERLIAGAAEIGRAAGHDEGLAEGREKGHEEGYSAALRASAETISQLESAWRRALDLLEGDRARMVAEARLDIVRLASVFAERVAKRAVELDCSTVERQIEAVVSAAIRPSRLVLAVHPDDAEPARDAMPALLERVGSSADVEITPDPSLRRGSCVARLAGGSIIDASVDTQIDRLIEAMLPGEGRAGRDARIDLPQENTAEQSAEQKAEETGEQTGDDSTGEPEKGQP